MGVLRNFINPLHKKSSRNYLERMQNDKVHCSEVARGYGRDFWDGDRKYGYGGYKYDGRWAAVARALVEVYGLADNARILDVGCGKGFLLYELKKLLANASVKGLDISAYSIAQAKEEIRQNLFIAKAQEPLPFKDKEFDLVISLNTLYNLSLPDLKASLQEVERVGQRKYVTMESYRSVQELFNLQCWALTCEQFFRPEEWVWLFKEFGYAGDYEFIYFE